MTPPVDWRTRWRKDLLARRESFASDPHFATSQDTLGASLHLVLQQLEPQCLGLYWPIRGEFDATRLCEAGQPAVAASLALPFAQRSPVRMAYRDWDGRQPNLVDECGIPCVQGAEVVPDVVLVPCVGFTRGGHRLGFGSGYFDRWLAAHPHVTTVGVAWSFCEVPEDQWVPAAHDQDLMLLVTERGVVS